MPGSAPWQRGARLRLRKWRFVRRGLFEHAVPLAASCRRSWPICRGRGNGDARRGAFAVTLPWLTKGRDGKRVVPPGESALPGRAFVIFGRKMGRTFSTASNSIARGSAKSSEFVKQRRSRSPSTRRRQSERRAFSFANWPAAHDQQPVNLGTHKLPKERSTFAAAHPRPTPGGPDALRVECDIGLVTLARAPSASRGVPLTTSELEPSPGHHAARNRASASTKHLY